LSDFEKLFQALGQSGVQFIVIGGFAAILHGSSHLTVDLDISYSRDPDNLKRLASALAPFQPYPRGAPPGLPFLWDAETLRRGLNFTLTTTLGDIDVLGEITGGGTYEDLLPHTHVVRVFGMECRCLGLRRLIQVKRAAGRPKDFEVVAELEAILEEQGDGGVETS
jgi:predicted nucleotidyltransferase